VTTADRTPRDPRKPEPPMLPEVQMADDPGNLCDAWNVAGMRARRWFRQIAHAVRMRWR
jgi:hypothetical protein